MNKRGMQLLSIIFLLLIILTPFIFSKYTSTYSKTITVNVRQPEYDVIFNHPLPNEYQEVEYIETLGNQYISTSYYLNSNNIKIKMGVSISDESFDNCSRMDLISNQNALQEGFFIGAYRNELKAYSNDETNSTDSSTIVPYNDKTRNDFEATYDYNKHNKTISANGIINSKIMNSTIASSTKTIKLFKNAYQDDNYFVGRTYYVEIYVDNILELNFIPCYRKSDNEIGLYDMVTKTFYTNSGTGSFIKGPDLTNGYHAAKSQHFIYGTAQNLLANNYTYTGHVFKNWNTVPNGTGITYENEQNVNSLTYVDGEQYNIYSQWEDSLITYEFYPNRLSSDYIELNYVRSDGKQAIITDVIPTDTTGAYIKLASNNVYNDGVYFGSGNTNTSSRFTILNSNDRVFYGWNTNMRPTDSNLGVISIGEIFTAKMNYLNDRNLVFNNTIGLSNLPTKNPNILPIVIFSFYIENRNAISPLKASMDLYELNLSEGNSVIRNYVPSYQVSSDTAGVYETVTNLFYSSVTDEDLIKGEEIKSTQEITYGNSENLNANTYLREGYVFVNWNTKPDGTGTTYSDEQLVTNNSSGLETIKLYAQWKPTFEVIGNPTVWTNQDVTLTVVPAANTAFQYSFDGGTTWQISASAVFSSNQDVHVKIKDSNGIVSDEVVVNITKIDKTPPTINFSMNPLIVTLDESNTISSLITPSDSQSGIDATGLIVYRNDIVSGRRTDQITNTTYFTYPGLYAIDVEVSDVAGNKTNLNSQILVRWPTAGKYIVRRTELDNLSGGVIGTGQATGGTSAGLYRDTAETGLDTSIPFSSKYYYSGASVNNYVSFAGTIYRVLNVPVNDDIKLIGELSSESIGWGNKKIFDSTIYSNWITKFGTSEYHQIYNTNDARIYKFSDTEWSHFDLATFYAGRFERNASRNSIDFK